MIAMLHLASGRKAIDHDGVRLAVPPIRRAISRDDWVRVLEYVLRRQPTLAQMIADGGLDEPRSVTFAREAEALMTHDWQTGEAA